MRPMRTRSKAGLEYQDWVRPRLACVGFNVQYNVSRKGQLTVGESSQGIEIKLDQRCTETGRVSIEIAEKSRASIPDWTPSGIFAGDNHVWYVVGNREMIFIFARKHLELIFHRENPEQHESFGTLRKFYIPIKRAAYVASAVLTSRDSSYARQHSFTFVGSTKALFGWDGGEHQIVRARPNGDMLVLEFSKKLLDDAWEQIGDPAARVLQNSKLAMDSKK
jgi:hypothetical protein